jgi:dolichol-phosphate hexosyltransferase
VDGKSTDRTREVATKWGAQVIVEPRKGYGRAYKTGFEAAKGDIIVTGDADGTYPFDEVHRFVEILDETSVDFITTNRFGELQKGAMSWRNRFGNAVLSVTLRTLFLRKVRDSQSGMWVFRRSVLDRMPSLDRFHDGMPFSEEIKIEAFCRGDIKAIEIPVRYQERTGEEKLDAWGDGWSNLMFLLKKRLTYRRRTQKDTQTVRASA